MRLYINRRTWIEPYKNSVSVIYFNSLSTIRTKTCLTPRKRWSWPTLRVWSTNWPINSCRPSSSTKPCWLCTLTRWQTHTCYNKYLEWNCDRDLSCVASPQAEQCNKLASNLQSQYPGHPKPVLVQVAQLCREKQHNKAIELLQVLDTLSSGSRFHLCRL